MKKLIAFILCLACLCGTTVCFAAAQNTDGLYDGYMKYTIVDGQVTITGYSNRYPSKVQIPSQIDGYPVTEIKNNAFQNCRAITELILPDTLVKIGRWAFDSCSIKNLFIPASVTDIADTAFLSNDTLESIAVYALNHTYYGLNNCLIEHKTNKLVLGCKNSIIPADGSVTIIGAHAFESCYGITKIDIPRNVTKIGEQAFFNCKNATEINIPSTVTEITVGAFAGCYNVTKVNVASDNSSYCAIENAIVRKSDKAIIFLCADCNIPANPNVQKIAKYSILVKKKKDIVFPANITEIHFDAFNKVSRLNSLIILNKDCSIEYINSNSVWRNTAMFVVTGGVLERQCENASVSFAPITVSSDIHKTSYVSQVNVTCTSDGKIGYWYCSICNKCYLDENSIYQVDANDLIIKKLGGKHTDSNGDAYCDNCDAFASEYCDHICHKDGFLGFIWKILNLFNKLFGSNKECNCGASHF